MAKQPTPRFVVIGRGKYVHVVHTDAFDRKHSQCLVVRKSTVAGKVPSGSLSPEAALSLDSCPNCGTAEVAKRMLPEEEKRAAAKDRRDETLAKAKVTTKAERKKKEAGKKPEKKTWYLSVDGRGWTSDPEQALKDDDGNFIQSRSQVKQPKERREPRSKVAKATKTGPRSTGRSTEDKVNALADFAKEHHWGVTVTDADPGMLLEAVRGEEVIRCYFVEGKYDTSRHASVSVGSWSGKLRGVHGCRAQMAAEGRDRPHPEPGKGRSGPRKKDVEDDVPEDESPEDAARRVPFLMDDDDIVILDAIMGTTIRWRNGTSKKIEEANIPSEVGKGKRPKVTLTTHPKTGKRILAFLEKIGEEDGVEIVGPERAVALDRIVRVIG